MALDDRVRTLEQEVNILKDQVRNTLLEIQEQILLHYYPDLRGKEPAPPGAALAALRDRPQAGRARAELREAVTEDRPAARPLESSPPPAAPAPAGNLSPVTPAPAESSPPPATPAPAGNLSPATLAPAESSPLPPTTLAPAGDLLSTTPIPGEVEWTIPAEVEKVPPTVARTLPATNGGNSPQLQPQLLPQEGYVPAPLPAPTDNPPAGTANIVAETQDPSSPRPVVGDDGRRVSMRRLLVWAGDAVAKIGRERTLKAMEIAVKGGYLDDEVRNLFVQLAELCDEEPIVEHVSLQVMVAVLLELDELLGGDGNVTKAQTLAEEVGVG